MGEVIIKPRTLKSGKIVYEYAFEIASVDGKRKRKTKSGFKTKKEAREAGKLAQQAYEQVGQAVEPSDMSFADFLDQWIEMECKLSCKEVTVNGYKKKIRLYIKPTLGEYRLKSITKNILQEFITKMYNDGFSTNTISSIKGILSKSFTFAVDRHYLMTSPATRLITPTNLQPNKPTRQKQHIYLTKEQIDSIFARFPEGTTAYIPLMIAYHTGLRLGEIYGLVWEDIDFKNKTLAVNRQVQWYQGERTQEEKKRTNGTSESNGYWYFSEPKYKSYRIIDLDDVILEILQTELAKQQKAKAYYDEYYTHYFTTNMLDFGGTKPTYKVQPINQIMNQKTTNEVHFICRRENGTYVNPRTTQHISSIVHKQLNIPDYDTYSFRHTHGTMLIENGADMVYVQRRLGHKDISVTMNIYTNHLTEKIKSRNNSMLNNMY